MKTSDRDLFDDLFPDGARAPALLQGARVLRRRRIVHRLARTVPPLAALLLIAILAVRRTTPADAPSGHLPPPGPSLALSDDELLACFPGTAKGFVTVNGEKRLIFPRPADAQRFLGRPSPIGVSRQM